MGVAKKGRRKIVRNGRTYYWRVGMDCHEDDRFYLSIVSEDKHFIVSYMLKQKNQTLPFSPLHPLIIVKGRQFKERTDVGGCWKRFLVPAWDDQVVTPRLVGEIIDWCMLKGNVQEVDFRGNPMAPDG